jgi:hypothetical protein
MLCQTALLALLLVPPAARLGTERHAHGSEVHLSATISVRATTSVRIYLVAIGDKGRFGKRIGCGDSLIAVTRPIPPTTAPLAAALRLLLDDHQPYFGQSGLYNSLYRSRLKLQRARVANGRATTYLVGRLQVGGVCDNPRVEGQLRQTVLQFRTVRSVAIFVNNVPLSRLLSGRGT